ncbi:MAG: hypothetical protein U0787_23020 [Polyangia bacterium]
MNRVPRRGMSGKREQSRYQNDPERGAQDTVVVVGGLDYAYDLSALADANNRISSGLGPIIYATHPYPFKGTPPHVEPDWDRYFGECIARCARHPGEWRR